MKEGSSCRSSGTGPTAYLLFADNAFTYKREGENPSKGKCMHQLCITTFLNVLHFKNIDQLKPKILGSKAVHLTWPGVKKSVEEKLKRNREIFKQCCGAGAASFGRSRSRNAMRLWLRQWYLSRLRI
jgi:hypothetical protein